MKKGGGSRGGREGEDGFSDEQNDERLTDRLKFSMV